ncbi:ATP-dependent DNA helicase PcrA [Aliiroseovarius sp. xm-m-379]|uniref:ATP-dependent helicase n=1 Tax=unclassified Aliiroseovarius TaxID=2623558 RepID=UPI0015688E7B|nr:MULTISPECIES: UvrD-helicase domain-containing protein [unclassified Aliiroseovarius]NRP12347.1 ATP-dependent DNA helicase PcrA [Aliiroseovarius sp. xm-d-517]NRP24721.1 ATP-dependent DNA helicase PcrA [Aliiroseovarius sp. xm-m-379]NRP30645.1 ATP-dependent DNA helicase PcrA [Aliiroseovarius sp. xm-m-314]NRP33520.1 ATP-dependent DNA helicase PcrA [Aliiroseovarius sp. xm-a-104]NRP40627.1 ATP-dependent DNA helicase PcrA [Aliiroseovarius sp. xm-m-339-2]
MSDIDDDDLFEEFEAGEPAPMAPAAPKIPLSQRALGMAASRPAPYLDGLNPAQREAVEALDGPVLMLAGAGTGKTKALTTRIAHLLYTRTAQPNQILSVTFTNKAAREMKNRVAALLGQTVEGMPWMGTFHSICVKLLRRHAELVGLKSNFTILDTDDQNRLLKQLIVAADIDEKRWPARLLSGVIDNWKNRAWTPAQVPTGDASAFNGKGVDLYHQYQERLKALNACDFGDLLLHMVTIFQTHEDILAQYQRWFRYILVDEYQDTNVAQYLWLRLLAQGHKNICCVGDDDQSIYGWRGAEVGNILRFEADFPGAKVVKLEQNYRSTAHILGAAAGVIRGNENRLGKELWTEAEGGDKVRLIGHWDGDEEARWVGEEIEAMQSGTRGQDPRSLDDIAILVRASHQMRAFEDRFLTIGLPYRVVGGPRFYERMEIRDAMAYFRLAVSQEDDLAFERIVNTPRRGLGDKAVQTIQIMARTNGVSLVEGARLAVEQGAIKGKGAKGLRELVDGLDRWHAILRVQGLPRSDDDALIEQPGELALDLSALPKDLPKTHIELAEMILDESGYTGHWQNDKTPEAPGRLENLKELVKALETFENLQGFLEHVSLIMDNDSDDAEEKVTIMTLHAAKGLEYPAVFLPGWEDGLFPSQRSMDESGLKGLEEERRLAYVGITRAEEICTISFASNRRVYGQWQSQLPSRFVDELPEEHVDVLTPPGLYGGGYGAAAGGFDMGVGSQIEQRARHADAYNSPGWKRMQANTGGRLRAKSSPSEAKGLVIDLAAVSSFTQGNRVFHQKFGYGTVMGVEGDKLDIEFDRAGAKKVLGKFLVPAEQAGDVPF